MMKRDFFSYVYLFVFCLFLVHAASLPASATMFTLVGDFQGCTAQGWSCGVSNPYPPINITDCGQLTIGYSYLHVTIICRCGWKLVLKCERILRRQLKMMMFIGLSPDDFIGVFPIEKTGFAPIDRKVCLFIMVVISFNL
jgi:hypothetical protein